jgi:hypothetical protein
MELIDKILSESDVEPIIIIQGDHGTASRFNFPTGGFDAHPTWEMFKERLGILNVYHLPGGGNKYLYDSISPVNTFRLIFNFYFGQHYELLNDESYYSIYEHPYRLLSEDDIINQRF